MNIAAPKILNTIGLIFMITMNMVAVLLPLGDKTTGELSALYPNLFVPAGFTFAIWSVIYILLILLVGYLWVGNKKEEVAEKLGYWFLLNTIANGLWLVFWHYEYVYISLCIMLLLLGSLIVMYKRMDLNYFLSTETPWQASIAISVYLGWISVATIANSTVVLVHSGLTDLGLSQDTWASIVLLVAVGIALRILYNHRDIFFASVVCWASFGIYSKRASDVVTLDSRIEHTAYICIFILLVAIILTTVQSFLKTKKSL